MAIGKWLMGGFAGAAIGAIIWILVSYYLNAEVGYVAVAIGFLAGLGVRLASRYDGTPPTTTQAVLAALIALITLLAAKYLVISLKVDEAILAKQLPVEGREQLKIEFYLQSFGLFDLLWIVFAISSAYGVANEDKSSPSAPTDSHDYESNDYETASDRHAAELGSPGDFPPKSDRPN
ncbi:hypothetical protein SH139x_000054 [Planctomycetaceae bacterium SH139]